MSFKSLIRFLGFRKLSIGLLIAAVICFFSLAILWFLNLIPPAPFMVWFLILTLAVPFLANVVVSLFTRRYAHTGNIVFHAAFVIIAIGIVLSLLYRFEGRAVLTEGSVFWGEKGDYMNYSAAKGIPVLRVIKKALVGNSRDNFDRLAPKVSFKLDKISPEYWGQRLHFTRLDGDVRYPAETLENKGVVKLNNGLKIDGARIRHTGFGFAPEILMEDAKSGRISRQTAVMQIFPPGSEDYFELGSYKIYIRILSDPVTEQNIPPVGTDFKSVPIKNKSMNLVDPVFRVRVAWLGQPLYEGVLKKGDIMRLGGANISFVAVKYWLAIEIAKDPGEMIVMIGFIAMAAGLLLRVFPYFLLRRETTQNTLSPSGRGPG